MRIDRTLARLLSNFFLDIAKAFFIATFITPSFGSNSPSEVLLILTRGLASVIVAIVVSWQLAKMEEAL